MRCTPAVGMARAPREITVVGGGLAGVATCWHLLRAATGGAGGRGGREASSPVRVRLIEGHGALGAGASGAAAGLLHAWAPGGGRRLHWGEEGLRATGETLAAAEDWTRRRGSPPLARRSGVLRVARDAEQSARWERLFAEGGVPAGLRTLSSAEAEALAPGIHAAGGVALSGFDDKGPAALLDPDGCVVDTRRYVEAMWGCCKELAEMTPGSTAELELGRHVESLAGLEAELRPDAVIIAAGAAAEALPELRGRLGLRLCLGHAVEMAPAGVSISDWPPDMPSLLGPVYLAARPGGAGATLGSTKIWGATPEEALRRDSSRPSDEGEAREVCAELLARAEELWAPSAAWVPREVLAGVRANTQRTHLGALPYVGLVPGPPGRWLLTGLGARGLVYHSLFARWLAAAVLADDPSGLPPECSAWLRRFDGVDDEQSRRDQLDPDP